VGGVIADQLALIFGADQEDHGLREQSLYIPLAVRAEGGAHGFHLSRDDFLALSGL